MDATTSIKFNTVDQYIATFPENTRVMLEKMRKTIQQTAPKAEELISYNMPAFKLNGMLVYYAGYKGHIGFYPAGSIQQVFKKELAGYATSKGTVRFSLDKALPVGLIREIIKYRVKQNREKAETKLKK